MLHWANCVISLILSFSFSFCVCVRLNNVDWSRLGLEIKFVHTLIGTSVCWKLCNWVSITTLKKNTMKHLENIIEIFDKTEALFVFHWLSTTNCRYLKHNKMPFIFFCVYFKYMFIHFILITRSMWNYDRWGREKKIECVNTVRILLFELFQYPFRHSSISLECCYRAQSYFI